MSNTKIKIKGISLDTTILQTNTAIDLIGYIVDQQEVILKVKAGDKIEKKEYDELATVYERIVTKHVGALHRRVGRTKFEKDFVNEDNEEELYDPTK